MTEVTNLLNAIESGDQQAAEQLLPVVYDELRRLFQATDLVHADRSWAFARAWLKAEMSTNE